MNHTTRRIVLAAGGAALLGSSASAAERFVYKDWTITLDAIKGPMPPALVKSMQTQFDIVDGLPIKPEAKAFFHTIPLSMDPEARGGGGNYSFDLNRIALTTVIQPPENPVFLHELLHGYHDQKLGRTNPTLLGFYNDAVKAQDFPPQAYLYTNPAEFYAMCASVVLWGKAARPPSTRANVKARMPRVYDWIVQDFGLTGV